MICKNCNIAIPDDVVFCPACGSQTNGNAQTNLGFCTSCGKQLASNAKFCTHCGQRVASSPITRSAVSESPLAANKAAAKVIGSYFVGIICMIASVATRIGLQKTIRISTLWENKYYVGIESDLKPIVSAIPIVAATILSILIVSDKAASKQRKTIAFIVNAVFILASFLVIWYDLPKALF